jgi:hypothetical protein
MTKAIRRQRQPSLIAIDKKKQMMTKDEMKETIITVMNKIG